MLNKINSGRLPMLKKILSIILSLIMVLGLIPLNAVGEVGGETTKMTPAFSDMPNDWSTKALENAVRNGLLNGADGKIMPKENLTRAQMATIINRGFLMKWQRPLRWVPLKEIITI
jgi:hypothetical protein